MKYRSEIDGLRAVAILPVVLFHSGVDALSGGYVGVDVFFVISGYLITRIIIDETEQHRFTLRSFYERRIRRIFPALAVMSLAVTVIAGFFYTMEAYRALVYSAAAAALSFANVYFWLKSGYFDPAAEEMPLLHTWSLGVEEQFYLAFPLLMILLRKAGLPWLAIILPPLLLSLIFSLWQVRVAPDAAFYLPFARIWELLLGSLIAIPAIPVLQSRALREGISALGLAAIVAAVLLYNEATRFPGEAALLPCIGTAALIYSNAGARTLVGRALSLRPMVFIGVISYSLYLWHWPVIVLTRYVLQRELSGAEIIPALLVMLLLAYLSWRYVEAPFRPRKLPAMVEPAGGNVTEGRRPHFLSQVREFRAFVAAGLVFATFIGIALLAWATRGMPQRFPADIRAMAAVAGDTNPRREECDGRSSQAMRAGRLCTMGMRSAPPSFALIGDSFGVALAPGIDAAAQQTGRSGYVMTRGGCHPLLGATQANRACSSFLQAARDFIAKKPEVDTVILVGRWSAIAEGSRFGEEPDPGSAVSRRNFRINMERTIAAFGGRRVVLVAFIPEQHVNVPQAAVVRARLGVGFDSAVDRVTFDERHAYVREVLTDLQGRLSFELVDASAALCTRAGCPAVSAGGTPLYVDDNHISSTTARSISWLFDPVFGSRGPA